MSTVGENSSKNMLLNIQAENQAQANDILGIALQDLYHELQKRESINSIPVFEDGGVEAPETEGDQSRLLLRKVIALEGAL